MPRAGLTPERIAAAALDLIDREGLQALSMRRLGRVMGVEAMALYHHFSNKEALLAAVVVEAFGRSSPPPESDDWREDLRVTGRAFRSAINRHPGLLPVLLRQPVRFRAFLEALERQYRALHRAGLRGQRLLDGHRAWGGYLYGYVVVEQQARSAGRPAAEWRPPAEPDLPLTGELDRYQAGRDWDEQFEIGLDVVLDGLTALVNRPGPDLR